MNRVFRNFVDSLLECVDIQDIHDCLLQITTAFDLSCFAYLSMPDKPGRHAELISTYPRDWTKRYLQEHYERIDPVIQHAHLEEDPFEWGPKIGPSRISQAQHQLFDEAAQFGIRYGFTIPIQSGRDRLSALTFATDEPNPSFRRSVEKKSDVLQLSAMLLHAHACRVRHGDRRIGGVTLSSRQFECLKWAARGKSATDIGSILNISPRTVAFHIESAKAKLGVRTTTQAVALVSAAHARIS